jgi:GNAT superfamily N-acetyltransferase
MIIYTQEFLCMCQSEVAPLAALEWEESGHPSDDLNVDWDRYYDLEENGLLKFFTARDGDKLVGYAVMILFEPLTIKGRKSAIYDAVYVAREYRGFGRGLFDFVEDCLRADGVERIVASSSVKNPIGAFLERMGYQEIETKYEKAI